MDYREFIDTKAVKVAKSGFEPTSSLNPALYPFQKSIVTWALAGGKRAIFADCGLGKTLMQLEWARHVCEHTNGSVLILAPLAVSQQTLREGERFGYTVNVCRSQDDAIAGINVTNYEMLSHFDPSTFSGVVLDESSILKSYSGSMRKEITSAFSDTPYRLACTATPSPNDHMELGTHAEFLGVMTRAEMLATYFTHDGGDTSKWRLKGHAKGDFWDFVASWSVMLRKPSDMGYEDDGFNLPNLIENVVTVDACMEADGTLFVTDAQGLNAQRRARKASMGARVRKVADMVNGSDDPWVVWCDYNAESEALASAIPDAVEVRGSDTQASKEDVLIGFSEGRYRVIVTKPSIAGFGMNWQHCSNVCFCGLSNSFEQYYQAVRRCWRYGQPHDVNVNIVVGEAESGIVSNVVRKAEDQAEMVSELSKRSFMARCKSNGPDRSVYMVDDEYGDGWHLMLGDCVERLGEIAEGSISYSIFSPPFSSLYTYSDSPRDMGNCTDDATFMAHFTFMLRELYRVMAPGRLVSFHCMNLPATIQRDGFIGIRDFRGDLIRAFEDVGFIYHSEVCIWKDPVVAMQRTKALGLLNKQKNKDSSMSRQGIPDYLVTMRKPGENADPISHTNDEFPIPVWQKIASPVWMDINQSHTLQRETARDGDDEKHICPLQLDVIDRALDLWSKPGDTVLSPFAGIGSEGFESVKKGRRFIGIELKPSYFDVAVKNLHIAEEESRQLTIDDFLRVAV